MARHSLQFKLVPITPIFSGGADQRPELLRGPSVKGLILWWVRAMLGGLGADPATTHELMDERFGNQESGSKVSLDIRGPRAEILCDGPSSTQREGLKYLLYGLDKRYCYYPNEPSDGLVLNLRFKDDATLRMCWCGLWLLSRLGGIGARCRRGMGSFEIHNAGNAPAGLPSLEPDDVSTRAGLANVVTAGLNQVATALAGSSSSLAFRSASAQPPFASGPLPDFSCFRTGFWRATLWSPNQSSWPEALDALGSDYYEHRRGSEARSIRGVSRFLSRDFSEADCYEATGAAKSSELAALGLPLTFRFTSYKHKGALVGIRAHTIDPREKTGMRRASPLFLRILRSRAGDYFCLAHFFKCRLVEKDELQFYMLKKSKAALAAKLPSTPFPVDWGHAEDFLKKVSRGSDIYV